jgi:aryl-phospho-beta-D-glucosidase BglC (GH1 family)
MYIINMVKWNLYILLAGLAFSLAFFSCQTTGNPDGNGNSASNGEGGEGGDGGDNSNQNGDNPPSGDYARAQAMNRKLGKGVNLGNAFDAKCRSNSEHGSDGNCPVGTLSSAMSTPSNGWSGCWSNPIKSGYYSNLKNQGFNSIRLPVRWAEKASDTSPYTIPSGFMSAVKQEVDNAISAGFLVIINIHHFNELFDDCEVRNDFNNQQQKFIKLWEQIADAFKNYSDDNLIFEILNEPHGRMTLVRFNTLLGEVWPKIRASNPNRTLMINSTNWGKYSTLTDVTIPRFNGETDKNVILSGHYYEPQCFTHSGEGDCQGSNAINNWSGGADGGMTLTNRIQTVYDALQAKYPGIPINIGEFGTINRVNNNTVRAAWLKEVVKEFNKKGFSWHYWAFPSAGQFNGYTCSDNNCTSGSWIDGFREALFQQ